MQKVKKAAAQLDSCAAISVLNNLKNNQIVVETGQTTAEIFQRAKTMENKQDVKQNKPRL